VQRFAPHIGLQGEGWATPEELAGPLLPEALELCGTSLGTDRPDIQGQRLVEVVTWCLALPGAAALIDGEDLPVLEGGDVLVWIGDEPPGGISIALGRNATAPGDLDTLRAALDVHLAPLVTAVNEATRRPRSALQRAVRDRLAAALAWVGELRGKPERAQALLAGQAELRMLDLGTDEMLLHVREGCCLYYRTPAALKCFSCPLLDDDDRRRLVTGGG
jgi:hypothetical protein